MAVAEDLGIPPAPGFERQPPQDIQAEQSVLGGMLLSKDAIADVVEVLRSTDFYRPAHQFVYDTILDLYGRGEPADAVTVSAELTRSGQLMRVGGAPYLHTLISSVPTAANAGYYAEIVAERAVLRRLVEAGTRIVQLGYGAAAGQGGEIDEVVDRAQAEIYDVTERRMSEDYVRLEQLLQGTMDEIDAISSRGGASLGVPTGFAELDQITNGLHPGQMVIIAARPAIGKSTLALDFARSCSIKSGMTSVIFSLEMSRSEITMRLLSAEAKVPLHHMRSGHMSDDDWARLARRMGEVADAPLFIDDSPNLTMMEIRAKSRRLRQRNDLRLVVVDYMQLMTSGKRVESRQVEVSEFSRSLKLLAKELEVPVVAISQLNRGPEQRQDKKPMLADLRESGCLTGETTLLRADTGAPVSFERLLAEGRQDVLVWSFDERRRLVPARVVNVFPSGLREVFRLRLASGRAVSATSNHPFLTAAGWTPLGELAVGDRVAVPRRTPAPRDAGLGWSASRIELLADLVGGRLVPSRRFGPEEPGRPGGAGPARVPEALFRATDDELARFFRRLWWTGGAAAADAGRSMRPVRYPTTSRRLADDMLALLSRLGILAWLTVRRMGGVPVHEVVVECGPGPCAFHQQVGAASCGCTAGGLARRAPAGRGSRTFAEVGGLVAGAAAVGRRRHVPGPAGAPPAGDLLAGDPPAGAGIPDRAEADDVWWDSVVAMTPLGPRPVYDATVEGTHNFIANGIAAHNSLEQDADMVVLLHREDAYERESPRAGEADLILAKHRNGPTGTVTVAFQGHYSRFVDMAT